MTRLLEGFDAYATAQVPASRKWTSATAVTISADDGRSGQTGDNAAHFSTAAGSVLAGPLAAVAVAGVYTVTWGHAVLIQTLTGSITLGAIVGGTSRMELLLDDTGTVTVRQIVGGVTLGTVCASAAGLVPIGTGGTYLELKVIYQLANSLAVQLRIRDWVGNMQPVASGALLGLDAGAPPDTLELGGGTETGTATWLVEDIYANDGVPAATAITYRGQSIFNDGFFGDTHIGTFYPLSDGPGLTSPWPPDAGSTGYTQIDEHPPDEDVSYVSSGAADQLSTYGYHSDLPARFATQGCTAGYRPIYAIQWDGRLRTTSTSGVIEAVVRRSVDGTLTNDILAYSDPLTVDNTAYAYVPAVFDRNPTASDVPFTWQAFYLVAPVPDALQWGILRVS